MDPLSLASFGVGGLAKLLEAMGIFKNPEDTRREAMKGYLEKNMPEFNYVEGKFNPSDFSDVLNPMMARQATQEKAMGNSVGLSGLGRSGVGTEMVLQNQRRNTGDLGNMFSKLVREKNADAYKQAMQKYQMDMQKAQLMAGVQG